ncbi:MAG: RimK/LysX family protein [Pseudomonadota bacterium]
MSFRGSAIVLAIAVSLGICAAARADVGGARLGDPTILGYVEDAFIGTLQLEMKAKLDTGADSSSVFARDVEVYQRSGRDNWVRFRLVGKNGRSIRFNKNVVRFASIKLKTGGVQRRPVVHLPLCVGGVQGLAEVNLADREDFEYDVLIGREFLASRIVVDSAQMFAANTECGAVKIE